MCTSESHHDYFHALAVARVRGGKGSRLSKAVCNVQGWDGLDLVLTRLPQAGAHLTCTPECHLFAYFHSMLRLVMTKLTRSSKEATYALIAYGSYLSQGFSIVAGR